MSRKTAICTLRSDECISKEALFNLLIHVDAQTCLNSEFVYLGLYNLCKNQICETNWGIVLCCCLIRFQLNLILNVCESLVFAVRKYWMFKLKKSKFLPLLRGRGRILNEHLNAYGVKSLLRTWLWYVQLRTHSHQHEKNCILVLNMEVWVSPCVKVPYKILAFPGNRVPMDPGSLLPDCTDI